jgi:hypothetical protein
MKVQVNSCKKRRQEIKNIKRKIIAEKLRYFRVIYGIEGTEQQEITRKWRIRSIMLKFILTAMEASYVHVICIDFQMVHDIYKYINLTKKIN